MDLASSPRSARVRHHCGPNCGPSPERSLGFGRVWVAVGVFIIAGVDFRSHELLRNTALLSAFGFIVYSLLVLFLVRSHQKWPGSTRLRLHCMDIVSAFLLAFLLRTSEAALILLFLFVLVAASQRWGPRQVLWNAGVFAVFLLFGELLLAFLVVPHVSLQYVMRPDPANVSLAGFVVFAAGLVWQLTKVHAAERWESSARAAQRVRALVSRELHDSAVQCLYAVGYRLEKVKCSTLDASLALSEDLARIQHLVQRSQVELRQLIMQGRLPDLGPTSFVEYVSDLTAEFEHDTGISARFCSDGDPIQLPPAVAGELVRIVQEALLNVKKHSGAQNVSIRLSAGQGRWRLLIHDDGRGFDFTGRLCMKELEAKGQGPYVIRERVTTLGGELEIESTPGRGARLEIALRKDALG
jgi:signal transduction histidine kinase